MKRTILIIDLEATCADDHSIPRAQTEIIEIGAVMVEAEKYGIIDEFVTFVKPRIHPRLHPFCSQLTSITQAQVDQAPPFPVALKLLLDWCRDYHPFLFTSWGGYDHRQLKRDCRSHGQEPPFNEHFNLKEGFSEKQGLSKKFGMAGALRMAGLPLEGTHHRGIDDARNMARLLPYIFGEAKIRKPAKPPARGERT